MNSYQEINSTYLYFAQLKRSLSAEFNGSCYPTFNNSLTATIIAAFQGFCSFDAFERATNSFKGFDCYAVNNVVHLRNLLLEQGYLNIYKLFTNFDSNKKLCKSDDWVDFDAEQNLNIGSVNAEKIASFLRGFHERERLTFIDIIEAKPSDSILVPMYVHKHDKAFIDAIDYYSSSHTVHSAQKKRAYKQKYIVSKEHFNIDMHHCFKDILGIYDLSSYYTILKVFKKVYYKNAEYATGKINQWSSPFSAKKNDKPVASMDQNDWEALCELADKSVQQKKLNLARFLFRFYKHPRQERTVTKSTPVGYRSFKHSSIRKLPVPLIARV